MIILPMAGESRRFKLAGYSQPKYFLPVSGRPLFDWTVLSFQKYFESELFLFIARDSYEVRELLKERIGVLGIKRSVCIFLNEPTRGQAETVYLGLQEFLNNSLCKSEGGYDEPMVIFNIDTIRPGIVFPELHKSMAWIEVFKAQGDHWSFVLPNQNKPHLVEACSEKVRISDLCCTGLYSFLSPAQFELAYLKELGSPSSFELFVAPIFNHILASGSSVAWHEVPSKKVLSAGVPTEYEALLRTDLNSIFRL